MDTTTEIKSIVIVKSLEQRDMVEGELSGPYPSKEEALEALLPGQRYEIRDGIMYAESVKA